MVRRRWGRGGGVELRLERAAEGLRGRCRHGHGGVAVCGVLYGVWLMEGGARGGVRSSKIDDRCKLQNKSKQIPRGNSTKTLRGDFFEFKSI